MLDVLTRISDLEPVMSAAPEVFSVLVNSRSHAEAGLALDVLREKVPERTLVKAINLREILQALPTFPCSMAVEDQTLAKVAGLTKDASLLKRRVPDVKGAWTAVTTAGNFCFDLFVVYRGKTLMWMPPSNSSDIVNPDVLKLVVRRPQILEDVIGLVQDMGLVFNPRFYLSLEDWGYDHAHEALEDFQALFF
ncbi:MAG: hypothetical protein QMD76_04405 [Anaerosomatales bacterium]|nr:hypothetical protein [Anaerosomatales bacterium]